MCQRTSTTACRCYLLQLPCLTAAVFGYGMQVLPLPGLPAEAAGLSAGRQHCAALHAACGGGD